MKEKNKRIFYVALCAILIIVIIWLIADAIFAAGHEEADIESATEEKTEFVEVEETVTAAMIQGELNDMGFLVTEEYCFTQVEKYEKKKTILKLFTSSSNCIYSYDGTVTAGVDFSEIHVEKNDVGKKIIITIPSATIKYVDIDYESFKEYSENEGLWNPITVEDYNDSMVDFEKSARENAKEKGVLERADENAEQIIQNFVSGMLDDSTYTIEWKQGDDSQ